MAVCESVSCSFIGDIWYCIFKMIVGWKFCVSINLPHYLERHMRAHLVLEDRLNSDQLSRACRKQIPRLLNSVTAILFGGIYFKNRLLAQYSVLFRPFSLFVMSLEVTLSSDLRPGVFLA